MLVFHDGGVSRWSIMMSFLELQIVTENVVIPGVGINLGVPESPSPVVTGAGRDRSQTKHIEEIKLIQRLLNTFLLLPLTRCAAPCLIPVRPLAWSCLSVPVRWVDPVEADGLDKTEIIQLLSLLLFKGPIVLAAAHCL